MPQAHAIDAADAGKRLDVFLTELHAGVSRSRIQKSIKAGEVTVNGKKATPHLALRAGDEVQVLKDIAPPDPNAPLAPRPDITLAIVHKDDAFLVIDKPSGLLVHPDVADETSSLANALVAAFPDIADVGESRERPGIVHRLDKEASGLLVVARTKPAYAALKRQFQDHTIEKTYLVLVHGTPSKAEGTITFAIGRQQGTGKMAARPEAGEGDRDATTHYKVLERFSGATLVEVRTETGRTHQIRVHMKAINCPVAGDALYGKPSLKPLPTERLFLHAAGLAFDHPVTGERMRFASPLPQTLERTLETLREGA